jgi:hypothetical protein
MLQSAIVDVPPSSVQAVVPPSISPIIASPRLEPNFELPTALPSPDLENSHIPSPIILSPRFEASQSQSSPIILSPSPSIDDDTIPLPTTQPDGVHTRYLDAELQREAADNLSNIPDIKLTQQYINLIRSATLKDDHFSPDVADRLRNPPQTVPELDLDVSMSIKGFLAGEMASEKVYSAWRDIVHERCLDVTMLSHHSVSRTVNELSGVVPVLEDMCINGCVAFTGPLASMQTCLICAEPRYDKRKKARQQYSYYPLGPQLQARRRSSDMAKKMHHHSNTIRDIYTYARANSGKVLPVKEISDIIDGEDIRQAIARGEISENDTLLFFSLDGAQLYQSKLSDCWIQIWILFNLSPELRYKKAHILPGMVIPGPNKPKNLDSFMFSGLRHLSALQKEGLRCWDAYLKTVVDDYPFLVFVGADTPAMAAVDGLVGHHGKAGCRLYCPLQGRRKELASQYFPVCLKPLSTYTVAGNPPIRKTYTVEGCCHEDWDLKQRWKWPSSETRER